MRTVTFTMEDALISPIGLQILTGAGLIQGEEGVRSIKVHTTETTDAFIYTADAVTVLLSKKPYVPESYRRQLTSKTEGNATTYSFSTDNNTKGGNDIRYKEDFIYVMPMQNGEILSEPYIPSEGTEYNSSQKKWQDPKDAFSETTLGSQTVYEITITNDYNDLTKFNGADAVLVDYYVEYFDDAWQIDIEPQMFGGNFYVEAETLFRDTNGVDSPAEFVIPNCKVQSNFTFSMAASGDPSTFTFTVDAFPDYTRWDKTKKVLASLQVIDTGSKTADFMRYGTKHDHSSTSTLPIIQSGDKKGEIANSLEAGSNTDNYTVKEGYNKFQKRFIEG